MVLALLSDGDSIAYTSLGWKYVERAKPTARVPVKDTDIISDEAASNVDYKPDLKIQ